MLERTEEKLSSMFAGEPQTGFDGKLHEMDGITKITVSQVKRMAELHEEIRPDLSIETGLAYGFSTLPILDAMNRLAYGHHVSIDPTHVSHWHGIALNAARELGFSDRFTFVDQPSNQAFSDLIVQRKRAQFIFLDGDHFFEAVICDVCLSDKLLDVGGILILNDLWLPAIRSVVSYITQNFTHYRVCSEPNRNIAVFKKVSEHKRPWDWFAPFDGAGALKRTFRQKLLGKKPSFWNM